MPVPVNEMVKTQFGDVPDRAAVPAGLAEAAGAVNASAAVPELASAMPAPLSEMMTLPLLGTVVTGVSVTLMVTDVAPVPVLLMVTIGAKVPKDVPARMAG